jgi:hypothetical protein
MAKSREITANDAAKPATCSVASGSCDIFSRGGQRRRQQHRGQEQETECQHPSQGQDVAAHKPPDPRSRRGFHLPDRVQGVLELNHDADGGKDQGANPYCGRDHAFARPVRALEHGFDGLSAGVADEPLQRAENLALHGLGAEDETGNRNRYENQRPEREHGVIGKRRAEPRILVLGPAADRISKRGEPRGHCLSTRSSQIAFDTVMRH